MNHPGIVKLQWAVIAVLVIGGGIAFFMLMGKTDQFKRERDANTGNVKSLAEQVKQAKAAPSPTVAPLPEAVSNGPSAATPTPAPTPPAATPKKAR